MGLKKDLKALEKRRTLGEVSEEEYEKRKNVILAYYDESNEGESKEQSGEYVFGGSQGFNPLTFGNESKPLFEEIHNVEAENDTDGQEGKEDLNLIPEEGVESNDSAKGRGQGDESKLKFAAFNGIDGKRIEAPWVTGNLDTLTAGEVDFIKDFLRLKLRNCEFGSFTEDELKCVTRLLPDQDLSKSFDDVEKAKKHFVDNKARSRKSVWRFVMGLVFIVGVIGLIVVSSTDWLSSDINPSVYLFNTVVVISIIWSLNVVRKFYSLNKNMVKKNGIWKTFNEAKSGVQVSFYYSGFMVMLAGIIGFSELTSSDSNEQQSRTTESNISSEDGAETTSNNGFILVSQVFENNENGFSTYLHFESDYDGSFGSMILSQKGCRYVYSYQLSGCCNISAEFFDSDCGGKSQNKNLRLNPDTRNIELDMNGQRFVFQPVL